MKGHMEMLATSPFAKTKRETLNLTPHLRLYVENNLHDFSIKPHSIRKLFKCEINKAKLIYGYIQERRRQIGILEPIICDGFIYLIENDAFRGWVNVV